MGPVLPVALTLALVGGAAAALASPSPSAPVSPRVTLTLSWSAPLGCPEGQEIRAGALAGLGAAEGVTSATHAKAEKAEKADKADKAERADKKRSLRLAAAGDLWAEAGGGYSLRLRLEGDGIVGERHLTGETCEALSEAAALLLTMAIETAWDRGEEISRGAPQVEAILSPDPTEAAGERPAEGGDGATRAIGAGDLEGAEGAEGAGGAGGTSGAKRAESAEGAEGASGAICADSTERLCDLGADPAGDMDRALDQAAGWSLGLRARGFVGFGILPGVIGGGGLGLLGVWRRGLVELYGVAGGPGEAESAVNPAVGGRFWQASGGLRACGRLGLGRWTPGTRGLGIALELPLCGLLEGGAIAGAGTGAVRARRAASGWIGVGAAAGLRLGLGPRFGLWLEGEALVSALRPRFHTDPSGPLWRAGVAGGRLGLGIDLRWGLR